MKNTLTLFGTVLVLVFVSVINGNGQTINLQLQNTYTLGTGALTPRFAVGDLNRDGRPDVVTAGGLVGQAFNVQLNNGSGGLGTPNPIGASLNATAVAIGDFNNDGNPDLAVGSVSNVGINIRLGDGTGNFPNGTNTAFAEAVTDIVTADFNGDGNLDLAMVNRNGTSNVKVLIGDGHGVFAAPTNFAVGASPLDIEVADFNSDGRPDMAVVAFATTATVTILLNNGSGFTAAPSIAWANATSNGKVVAADFNRDCKTDLAVVRTDSIAILLGDNTGNFSISSVAETSPTSVIAADLNLDRIPDIAVGHLTGPNFTAQPGDGAGNFGTAFPLTLTNSIDNVALLDVNLDGRMDVLMSQRSNSFSLYNDASNYFRRTDSDYDKDGRADLAVFRPSAGDWYLLRGTQGFVGSHWGALGDRPIAADFDGDLKTDIAVWRENGWGDPNKSYFFILRSSDSSFQAEQFGRVGDVPTVSGDWDGDGHADAAVYRAGATAGAQSYFYYRPSSMPGTDFVPVAWGSNGDQAVRGDFDGDGRSDATIFRPSNGTWYILQSSNGQPRFQPFGLSTDRPVSADYDGDSHTDIAVFRPSNNVWYILNSATSLISYATWGLNGDSLVPGDYNGDGKAEVAVYRPSDQRWYVPPCANFTGIQQKFGTSGDIAVQAAP